MEADDGFLERTLEDMGEVVAAVASATTAVGESF